MALVCVSLNTTGKKVEGISKRKRTSRRVRRIHIRSSEYDLDKRTTVTCKGHIKELPRQYRYDLCLMESNIQSGGKKIPNYQAISVVLKIRVGPV